MSDTLEQVGDVVRMPDGTEYRGIIEIYGETDPPEDDGQWPILQIEFHNGPVATALSEAAGPYADTFNNLANLGGCKTEAFERYLRIFHNVTLFHEYCPNQMTDYAYIAFDPAEWRERMGVDTWHISKNEPLAEIQAWIEGDVWCSWIEHRYNPDEALADDEGWIGRDEEGITTYGLYGREYAEQQIADQLEWAKKNHWPVDRYPEHEKLDEHEDKINTILHFLDGIRDGAGQFGYSHVLAAITGSSEYNGNHLEEVPDTQHERIVLEHFRIDYTKIQAERELMYQRTVEACEKGKDVKAD